MSDKMKDYLNIVLALLFLFGFLGMSLFGPAKEISRTERRALHQFPELSAKTVWVKKGQLSFMDEFEKYVSDQFPFRESFRTIYAGFSYYGIGRREVNEIYYEDGYILKTEPVIHSQSVAWSLDRMEFIYDQYLKDNPVYFAVIPDKNYYFSDKSHIPYFDYDAFVDTFRKQTDTFATYIDIKSSLSKEAYYRTDTHWRQECIVPVAKKLSEEMGNTFDFSYEQCLLSDDFKGVYYGQGALPVKPDALFYLLEDDFYDYSVKCFDRGTEEPIPLYDMKKAEGMDPYEFFLSGSRALITIENPNCTTGRELVLFRDSFGSSIAPLFLCNYQKVTLVDIRYISPSVLDRFVEFEGADVLFLFSAQVLNNSTGQFLK